MDNEQIAADIDSLLDGQAVFCDSAEPKSIKELKKEGIKAKPAAKGPDSVRHGIQWLKKYTIIIHPGCINFRRELEQYQWKKDKWGESMSIPVGRNDHTLDALRYAFSHDSNKISVPIKAKATVQNYARGEN